MTVVPEPELTLFNTCRLSPIAPKSLKTQRSIVFPTPWVPFDGARKKKKFITDY